MGLLPKEMVEAVKRSDRFINVAWQSGTPINGVTFGEFSVDYLCRCYCELWEEHERVKALVIGAVDSYVAKRTSGSKYSSELTADEVDFMMLKMIEKAPTYDVLPESDIEGAIAKRRGDRSVHVFNAQDSEWVLLGPPGVYPEAWFT